MMDEMVRPGAISEERMLELGLAMLAAPEKLMEGGRLVELPVEHEFLPGLYVRRLIGLAGSLAVTEVHRTRHPWFMISGRITVKDVGSGQVFELVGPCSGVTEAGTQRIVYAHEETVFVTVHLNSDDERDLDIVEERLFDRRKLPGGETITGLFRKQLLLGGIGR